jgi:hypothetical protein
MNGKNSAADEVTVNLEAFNKQLFGTRVLCQGPFSKGSYAPVMEAVTHLRQPFRKKVLITKKNVVGGSGSGSGIGSNIPLQYDTVFSISDNTDWSHAIQYCKTVQGCLLIVFDDIVIPDAVWQHIVKGTTVVHYMNSVCNNIKPYDTIFFPPVDDVMNYKIDVTFRQLQAVYRTSWKEREFKEILNELRVAQAGLCWTRVQEKDSVFGTICWYDSVEQIVKERISDAQLAALFEWLRGQFV